MSRIGNGLRGCKDVPTAEKVFRHGRNVFSIMVIGRNEGQRFAGLFSAVRIDRRTYDIRRPLFGGSPPTINASMGAIVVPFQAVAPRERAKRRSLLAEPASFGPLTEVQGG